MLQIAYLIVQGVMIVDKLEGGVGAQYSWYVIWIPTYVLLVVLGYFLGIDWRQQRKWSRHS